MGVPEHDLWFCVWLQSANNLLSRYRGSDSNLYQRNLEAQALLAQQQALGLGLQGLSSQTALDLLQASCCFCQLLYYPVLPKTMFMAVAETQLHLLLTPSCTCYHLSLGLTLQCLLLALLFHKAQFMLECMSVVAPLLLS